jgi:glycosyltransferase involved in cell wall biosynthesis
MRVGFDARMLHASGIGTHIRGLLEAVHELPEHERPKFTHFGVPTELNKYPYMAGVHVPFTAKVYSFRERFGFPRAAGFDFYHVPHYNVPQRMDRPYAVTIHDLIHILVPEVLKSPAKMAYARYLMKSAADRAEVIFTISESSKRDIMEQLGAPAEKLVYVPNAVSSSWKRADKFQVEQVRKSYDLNRPFMLAVGVNKPHKNFPWLVRSYAAWKGRSDVDLVICGVKAHNSAPLRALAAESGVAEKVRFIEYLDHDRLPALYQAAFALVFPSLYEGFGIPIIEANQLGVPVLSSNVTSMPEVGADAAIYFVPRSTDSLHSALDQLITSDSLRERLISSGYANAARYKWADAARITVDTYRRVFHTQR